MMENNKGLSNLGIVSLLGIAAMLVVGVMYLMPMLKEQPASVQVGPTLDLYRYDDSIVKHWNQSVWDLGKDSYQLPRKSPEDVIDTLNGYLVQLQSKPAPDVRAELLEGAEQVGDPLMKELHKYVQRLDALPDSGQVNASMTPGEIIDHLLEVTQTDSIYDAAMVLITRTNPCALKVWKWKLKEQKWSCSDAMNFLQEGYPRVYDWILKAQS